MRIAIDATAACTPRPTGIGRYTAQLARALDDIGSTISLGTRCSHLHRHRHRLRIPTIRSFWIQEPWWPAWARPDVVHVTDSRVPRWRSARVATLHDVVHLLPEKKRDFYISTRQFRDKKLAAYQSLASQCHRIIAVSETTRRDFLEGVDCDPNKVVVVHHGIDPVFRPIPPVEAAPILAARKIPEGAIIYVGDLSHRKNIPGLIEGFLAADLGEIPLVIAGEPSFGGDELLSLIEREGQGRVHLVGWHGDDVLPALYSSARALLYPTHYEGFGMPVLEAMACDTPVVISNTGAAPEIAGEMAEKCDPDDPASISAALHRALGHEQKEKELARKHAETFDWQACARETVDVYQQAIEVAGGAN
ncbi:MAG: glycosyltransferase family 1 protein [Planctomycetota bacterium]|nr:glycosyltransferase family 1 protein [Planctomycetota bacterium]